MRDPPLPLAAIRESTPPQAVILALRRSRARVLVLHVLAVGGPATPSEIGRRTGLAPTAVYGALRGLGRRYRARESLVELGLAYRTACPEGDGRYAALPHAPVVLEAMFGRAPPTLMGLPVDSASG